MKYIFYFTKKIHSFAGSILYLNLIGMVLISLFEGAGILLLIPLIHLTGMFNLHTQPVPFLSWFSAIFNHVPKSWGLPFILCIYVLLIVLQSFFQRKQTIVNVKIQQGFIRHLREETYKSLIQSNWSFYLNKRKSDIINLMTTEIARVSAGIQMFLQFLTSLVFTFIQLCIAFFLSAKLTLYVFLFGAAIIFFLRKFIRKSNSLGKETVELNQMFLAGITEQFNGIKDIKSNMLEESHLHWFRATSKKIEKNIVKLAKLNSISQLAYKVISAFLIAAFAFFSIKMFRAQPAQLILIVMIFSRLWPRFSGIQSSLEQLGAISPSFKTLIDLQEQCKVSQEIHTEELYLVKPMTIKKGLECRNVFFRYDASKLDHALKNINIQIPANLMTAIVGRSGAGKSTLIDLLMGLNQPEAGEVLIDGVPLNSENLLSLRRSISYVAQDPFLFNHTIRENLLIIDRHASEEQIWEALEFAAAADFVSQLPQGLDTLIGDRGIRLSGGERQRIVLARAILRQPSILVLDEATSALDTENESKIQEALERIKGKMTIIIIAHRLSTIRNADQVIVLEKGEIIQQGEFNLLAKEQGGMFKHLLEKQLPIGVNEGILS